MAQAATELGLPAGEDMAMAWLATGKEKKSGSWRMAHSPAPTWALSTSLGHGRGSSPAVFRRECPLLYADPQELPQALRAGPPLSLHLRITATEADNLGMLTM